MVWALRVAIAFVVSFIGCTAALLGGMPLPTWMPMVYAPGFVLMVAIQSWLVSRRQ